MASSKVNVSQVPKYCTGFECVGGDERATIQWYFDCNTRFKNDNKAKAECGETHLEAYLQSMALLEQIQRGK